MYFMSWFWKERPLSLKTDISSTILQERLLYMAISLLLNMAEDVSVEKRMQKCHLVVIGVSFSGVYLTSVCQWECDNMTDHMKEMVLFCKTETFHMLCGWIAVEQEHLCKILNRKSVALLTMWDKFLYSFLWQPMWVSCKGVDFLDQLNLDSLSLLPSWSTLKMCLIVSQLETMTNGKASGVGEKNLLYV